jgi:hypothetical protein
LLLEALVDERPGTIPFFIDFAFSIVGTATGTVQQSLMARRDGADARSIAQDTVTALVANLVEIAWPILNAEEEGVQSGDNRLTIIRTYSLHS